MGSAGQPAGGAGLGFYGDIFANQGDHEQMQASFKESLILNRQLGHQLGVTAALMAFAALNVQQKKHIRAASLSGAVEVRLAEIDASFFVSDEIEYRRYLTALRAERLGLPLPPRTLKVAP